MSRFCFHCGGDGDEPDHARRCDGQQGRVEALEPAAVDLRGMVRADDLYTSVEAAESVEPHLSSLQERVMVAFRECGTLSDDRLERLRQFVAYAYSTVRKRRTELCQLGILVAVGDEINSRGRRMLVWAMRDECIETTPGVFQYVGRVQ